MQKNVKYILPWFAKFEMIIGEMARLFMHILYLAKSIFKSYIYPQGGGDNGLFMTLVPKVLKFLFVSLTTLGTFIEF